MHEEITTTDMRECVKRGAAMLDERYPFWYMLIDTEELNMLCEEECICGQLLESDSVWADYDLARHLTHCVTSVEYGFNMQISSTDELWSALKAQWVGEVKMRLGIRKITEIQRFIKHLKNCG